MVYSFLTSYKSCTLQIEVQCVKDCKIMVEVCDSKLANTYLTKRFRYFTAGEKKTFSVQMPITGKAVIASVYREGTNPVGSPVDFAITSVKLLPLARQIDALPEADGLKSFISFAERFCFNAGVLPTYNNRYYISDRGDFRIKYVDVIKDESGSDHVTPARINIWDKVIEVSKAKFLPMTVPNRFCILTHEYSHLFVNKDMKNEVEADLNGLHIYLVLGYPRIEALETYLSTFYSVQSDENIDRYERIKKFVSEFEKLNFIYA